MKRNKTNDLNIIKQVSILYTEKLLNKNILFIYLKNNKLDFYEVTFLAEHFKHLCGVTCALNAYEFFYKSTNNRLKSSDFSYKNNTTVLKLDNLVKSMNLSSYSKMLGEFKKNKKYLSVDKITGNNNLIIGFDHGKNINYPKTLLKGDIRDYTENKPYRIIGIFTKNIHDKHYSNLTYLAKNIDFKIFSLNPQLKNILKF